MGKVIGQRWEIYEYDLVKDETLKRGEKVVVKETPDFEEAVIQLISNAKNRRIEDLYNDYKNGVGYPFRTAEEQDSRDAAEAAARQRGDEETLASAQDYADQVAQNEWLAPVNTTAELKTTGLSGKKNYLCKVVADPVKSGVYQAVEGWEDEPEWALFDDAVDLVNEQELAEAVDEHNKDEAAHEDIREAIGRETAARNQQIHEITGAVNEHRADTNNPHEVNKDQVGLSNVTDDAQVKRSEMGAAGGVATLDGNGLVPPEQLPEINAGLEDAPADNKLYGRKDGAWAESGDASREETKQAIQDHNNDEEAHKNIRRGSLFFIVTTDTAIAPGEAGLNDLIINGGTGNLNIAGIDTEIGDIVKITQLDPLSVETAGNIRGKQGIRGKTGPTGSLENIICGMDDIEPDSELPAGFLYCVYQ